MVEQIHLIHHCLVLQKYSLFVSLCWSKVLPERRFACGLMRGSEIRDDRQARSGRAFGVEEPANAAPRRLRRRRVQIRGKWISASANRMAHCVSSSRLDLNGEYTLKCQSRIRWSISYYLFSGAAIHMSCREACRWSSDDSQENHNSYNLWVRHRYSRRKSSSLSVPRGLSGLLVRALSARRAGRICTAQSCSGRQWAQWRPEAADKPQNSRTRPRRFHKRRSECLENSSARNRTGRMQTVDERIGAVGRHWLVLRCSAAATSSGRWRARLCFETAFVDCFLLLCFTRRRRFRRRFLRGEVLSAGGESSDPFSYLCRLVRFAR